MDNSEKSPCCVAAGIQEVSLHDQDVSASPIAGNTHSAATLDAEMTAVLRSFLRALAKADVAKQARQQMHEKTMEHTAGILPPPPTTSTPEAQLASECRSSEDRISMVSRSKEN